MKKTLLIGGILPRSGNFRCVDGVVQVYASQGVVTPCADSLTEYIHELTEISVIFKDAIIEHVDGGEGCEGYRRGCETTVTGWRTVLSPDELAAVESVDWNE